MIFNFYESWKYIEPYHFTLFELCLGTMWLIWIFSFQKMRIFNKDVINVWYIAILTSNHIQMEDEKYS
jgi:hypothetical protein